MLSVILLILLSTALSVITNLVSSFIQPTADKNKRLAISIFVALVISIILLTVLSNQDKPPETRQDTQKKVISENQPSSITPPLRSSQNPSNPSPSPEKSPLEDTSTSTYRSVKDLELKKCIKENGGTGGFILIQKKDVSVARQIFTTLFSIGYYYGWRGATPSLTCKIPNGYKTLNLEFGRADSDDTGYMDDRGTSIITAFIDGDEVKSEFIESGQNKSLQLNVYNKKNLAIEFKCRTDTGCGKVYFWNARFE